MHIYYVENDCKNMWAAGSNRYGACGVIKMLMVIYIHSKNSKKSHSLGKQ